MTDERLVWASRYLHFGCWLVSALAVSLHPLTVKVRRIRPIYSRRLLFGCSQIVVLSHNLSTNYIFS